MTDSYLIHLRPLSSDIPVTIRLRRALKALLRMFHFECTMIEETKNVVAHRDDTSGPAEHLVSTYQWSMPGGPDAANKEVV